MTGELSHAGRALVALETELRQVRQALTTHAARVRELEAVLAGLEWQWDEWDTAYSCPQCGGRQSVGHHASCELSAALRRGER